LREWAVPGKAIESRQAAIAKPRPLGKGNKEITAQIAMLSNRGALSHFDTPPSGRSALAATRPRFLRCNHC